MPLRVGDIRKDEDRLLRDDNHSLGHLFRQRERTPMRLSWALRLSLQVEAIFLLVLLTIFLPRWDLALLCLAIAAIIAGLWIATLAVLVAGAVKGKLHSRVHRSPMLFWSWWPFWMCLMCCIAAITAGALCFYLWSAYLRTYSHLAGLEVYERVDPSIVPGLQVQDAGLIDFGEGVDIDRARGGCLVQGGHTYCVAPILHGGRVLDNLGDAPRFGTYDYFAVGVDCCACPNRDFRCGDWRNPMAHGGVRSKDTESRPFYRLAVDEWAATYEKKLGYPLFFDWVDDPVYRWNALWSRAAHLAGVYALVPFVAAFLLTMALSVWLESLVRAGTASPNGTPAPPHGYERLWEAFLAEMYQYHLDEQRQLLGVPGPSPWYGTSHIGKEHVPDTAKITRGATPKPGVKFV